MGESAVIVALDGKIVDSDEANSNVIQPLGSISSEGYKVFVKFCNVICPKLRICGMQ